MNTIFNKSIELNSKIEKFLNTISDALTLFEKEILAYLENDDEAFRDTFNRICALESQADQLESDIKTMLYKYLLLPDTRADVLSLIKSLDNIIDATEETAKEFWIQKPVFPECLVKDLKALTNNSIKAAEALLFAVRAFFNEMHLVNAHTSKTLFYEHETDVLEDKINDQIFNGQILETLAEKMQLKFFVNQISDISDEAEIISEKITIFTIKREI